MKKKLLIFLSCFLTFFSSINVNAKKTTETTTEILTDEEGNEIRNTESDVIYDTSTTEESGDITNYYDMPEINSPSAIVMDISSGTILYEKDINNEYYPGSLVKVMTAILAVDSGISLNEKLVYTEEMRNNLPSDASTISLLPGEPISLEDALYALLMSSANDCSLAISYQISGSDLEFAKAMNEKAKELGCTHTNFTNSTGIYDEAMKTSVSDFAKIGICAYKTGNLSKIMGCTSHTVPATDYEKEKALWQTDTMLFKTHSTYYSFCVGGKVSNSGGEDSALLTFAEKDDKLLVAVVMGSKVANLYKDTTTIFEYAFNNYHIIKPLEDFSFDERISSNVVSDIYYGNLDHDLPSFYVNSDYSLLTHNSISVNDLKYDIKFSANKTAKIVGEVDILYKNKVIDSSPIYSNTDLYFVGEEATEEVIPEEKKTLSGLSIIMLIILGISVVYIIVIIIILKVRKKKRTEKKKNKLASSDNDNSSDNSSDNYSEATNDIDEDDENSSFDDYNEADYFDD